MLQRKLIAVSLAYAARFVRPAVPYAAVQVAYVVGFFLPNPKHFVYAGLEKGAPQSDYRKLVSQVVTVDDTKLFYCVRGSPVLPARAHVEVSVGIAFV